MSGGLEGRSLANLHGLLNWPDPTQCLRRSLIGDDGFTVGVTGQRYMLAGENQLNIAVFVRLEMGHNRRGRDMGVFAFKSDADKMHGAASNAGL